MRGKTAVVLAGVMLLLHCAAFASSRRRSVDPRSTAAFIEHTCRRVEAQKADEVVACIRAFVAAHQPAPPRLIFDLDTYASNRQIIRLVETNGCVAPPQLLQDIVDREQAETMDAATGELLDFAGACGCVR